MPELVQAPAEAGDGHGRRDVQAKLALVGADAASSKAIKAALAILGIGSGLPAEPLRPLPPEHIHDVAHLTTALTADLAPTVRRT